MIEFLKRGLLHAHILIILKAKYKIVKPNQYDKIISTEIVGPTRYLSLHDKSCETYDV